MKFKPNAKLDAALAALEPDMIETLQRWVRVPSLLGTAAAGAPFGAEVRRVLDTALEDVRRLGMEARDIDGYCLDAEIGEGEETIAVLAHLDVVPEGEGWHDDPYGATIRDGRMIGRGTADDKGPAVAALFAMKAILDAGIPLRRKCRLILGCDEESGMQDLAYYEKKIGLPAVGFSPDANFPLINTEKGITAMELTAPVTDTRLLQLSSGLRCNVVPGKATALLAGDLRAEAAEAFEPLSDECEIETSLEDGNTRVIVTGVPAHASTPEKGKNAAKMLLSTLKKLEIGGAPVSLLVEASAEGDRGVNLGIAGEDAVSGPLTINLGLLSLTDGKLSVTYDCRFPVMFSGARVRETVAKRLSPAGFSLMPGRLTEPHHVPESSELVTKLMAVYNGITGSKDKPYAIGGGTYAKHLAEGVAFGMLFPGEPETEHQADESIDLANFAKAARIYAYSILALCGA
ncbi:MAG: Sapep family Mn(2+)-dependent dipeptidase [Clostridiales bacterium]|nr:Sapep family Mn(2+)-dependent dipeptidase [Clostridiales bacterium]